MSDPVWSDSRSLSAQSGGSRSAGASSLRHYGGTLFVLVAALAATLADTPGTSDSAYWLRWTQAALDSGLRASYSTTGDVYPPLTLVVFVAAARVGSLFGLGILASIKASLWIFLVATGAVFWRWSRRAELAALVMASLAVESVGLAYTDIYFAPFLLAALRDVSRSKWRRAALLFTIASLFKWLTLVIAPFLLVHYWRSEAASIRRVGGWIRFGSEILTPVVGALALVLIGMGTEVLATLTRVRRLDPFLSGNALNANWLLTYILEASSWLGAPPLDHGEVRYLETVDPRLTVPSMLLFSATFVFILATFAGFRFGFSGFLRYAQVGFLSYFVLATRVHENHLFIAVILGAATMVAAGSVTREFIWWALALNVNLFLFYGLNGLGPSVPRVIGIDLTVVFASLIVAGFCHEAVRCWRSSCPIATNQPGRVEHFDQ